MAIGIVTPLYSNLDAKSFRSRSHTPSVVCPTVVAITTPSPSLPPTAQTSSLEHSADQINDDTRETQQIAIHDLPASRAVRFFDTCHPVRRNTPPEINNSPSETNEDQKTLADIRRYQIIVPTKILL